MWFFYLERTVFCPFASCYYSACPPCVICFVQRSSCGHRNWGLTAEYFSPSHSVIV